MSSLFVSFCANSSDWGSLGAGSRKTSANGGLGDEIGENLGQLEQITLDTVTPRAAPRNSFALFSRIPQKVVDKKGKCLYNTRIRKIKTGKNDR